MGKEKKRLGLFDIFSMGYGSAIGSGIFILLGLGIAQTGRSVWLAVILGGVYAMMTFFYNYVVGSFFPLKGGDYSQNALLLPSWLMGMYSYSYILFPLSYYAFGIYTVEYASAVFPALANFKIPLAALLLTLAFLLTFKGSHIVAKVQDLMTGVLIVSLAIFIVFGLTKVDLGAYFKMDKGMFAGGVTGFFGAASTMMFACQGVSVTTASFAIHTQKPTKTIPKGSALGTLAVIVTYTLMAIVASGALPIEQVAGGDLTVVAGQVFPRWVFVVFVLGGAVCALLTSLLSGVAMLPNPCLKIAEDGWLPKVCTKTTKSGYPWVVMVLVYVITIIPLPFDLSFDTVLAILQVPVALLCMGCNIACIWLPKRYPEQWKKSALHMPYPLFVVLMIVAACLAGVVAWGYLIALTVPLMVVTLVITVALAGFAWWCLKTGAVSEERMKDVREAISLEAENAATE